MKALRVVLCGIAVYAVTLLLLIHGLHVPAKSDWYWLPFIASLAAVVGLGMQGRTPLVQRLLGVALCGGLVLVVDLAGVIWYSCAKGICS